MMLLLPVLLFVTTVCSRVGAEEDDVVDWLVARDAEKTEAKVLYDQCWEEYDEAGDNASVCGIELTNGLMSRRFVTAPAFGTIDWIVHAPAFFGGSRSLFRAASPEARANVSGTSYDIGGLASNSTFRAYCNRSEFFENLIEDSAPTTLRWTGATRVSLPRAAFAWTPGLRGAPNDLNWPPAGVTLEVDFETADKSFEATVFYELYDGIPLMTKWLELKAANGNNNASSAKNTNEEEDELFILHSVTPEIFAANGGDGAYVAHGSKIPGEFGDDGAAESVPGSAPGALLYVKTDQAYGATCAWLDDYPNSADPVDSCDTCKDEGSVEPLLSCTATPGVDLNSSSFISFKAMSLGLDSTDLTRATLAKHASTKVLAPWTTENPIFFHYAPDEDTEEAYEHAVRQMNEVGFELFIFSFGNEDFQMETKNATYLAHIKSRVDFAKTFDIEVGGYDLIVLDRGHGGYGGDVGDEWVAVNADGSLSENACFASGWTDVLFDDIFGFINATGLSNLETDGPYGGGKCAAENHSHHKGLEDSVYKQNYYQSLFYQKCRDLGVYVNQPDEYFFQGGNRAPMGYSEQQYSLPTWRDLTISRAGMFDDFYARLPTQGWMFVPITVYHAGGEPAEFDDKAAAYEWALAQYLGGGVAACYRGPYLWNNATDEGQLIRGLLLKWVAFYNKYRPTLIAPVVHLRRPDAQSWDGWLHVNPFSTAEVGVAMIFNPTNKHLSIALRLPLYYCGLNDTALITLDENQTTTVALNRDYTATIRVEAPPVSIHTIVVHPPNNALVVSRGGRAGNADIAFA